MNLKIGSIGFGEASFHICKGFKEEGIKGVKAFDVLFQDEKGIELNKKKLSDTEVTPVDSIDKLVGSCDIIFLAVPARFAQSAAETALGMMTKDKILIDITTNKPHIKKELGDMFNERGMLYVDASVMGAVPLYKHRTPTLISGNGATKMMELLTPIGMDLTYVGEVAGRAVMMKLTRSIFIKGVEALTLEMLLTARKLGIEKEIVEGLHKSFETQGFTKMVGQLVTSNVIHSKRRAIEAEECAELERELGFEPTMMEAAQKTLEWSASLGFAQLTPVPECTTLNDLYDLWEKSGLFSTEKEQIIN